MVEVRIVIRVVRSPGDVLINGFDSPGEVFGRQSRGARLALMTDAAVHAAVSDDIVVARFTMVVGGMRQQRLIQLCDCGGGRGIFQGVQVVLYDVVRRRLLVHGPPLRGCVHEIVEFVVAVIEKIAILDKETEMVIICS